MKDKTVKYLSGVYTARIGPDGNFVVCTDAGTFLLAEVLSQVMFSGGQWKSLGSVLSSNMMAESMLINIFIIITDQDDSPAIKYFRKNDSETNS